MYQFLRIVLQKKRKPSSPRLSKQTGNITPLITPNNSKTSASNFIARPTTYFLFSSTSRISRMYQVSPTLSVTPRTQPEALISNRTTKATSYLYRLKEIRRYLKQLMSEKLLACFFVFFSTFVCMCVCVLFVSIGDSFRRSSDSNPTTFGI